MSRLTLTAQPPGQAPIQVNFDNATKLLSFQEPNNFVGVVTYGQAVIGLRTAQSFVPAFEAQLAAEAHNEGHQRLSVRGFAEKFSAFFMQQWQSVVATDYLGPAMTFVVAGFDEGEPYGKVFTIDVPSTPELTEVHPRPEDFGVTWGGQREIVDRLLQGIDGRLLDSLRQINLSAEQTATVDAALRQIQLSIPLAVLPLQDCIDLAIFFISTTISAQKLTVGIRGVGGPIDVATITQKNGIQFVQQKKIHGAAN